MSGPIYNAVIPNAQAEVNASAADYACPSNTVGIRVNDVSAGTSVQLAFTGAGSVVHDNLANGDEIVGRIKTIVAAGTTCESVIVFYNV